MVDLSQLKSPLQWNGQRAKSEEAVLSVIGPVVRRSTELQLKVIEEVDFPGFIRQRVNYFVDEWNRVSAWLFVPSGKEESPAIVCLHQETPQGKDEPAGLEGDPRLAFARHYAEAGYVTIAPDALTAGERVSGRNKPLDSTSYYKENKKSSLLAKMLADHMSAVDVLAEIPRVDTARIGAIGHGLGATNALLLAAFDDRVLACVASCGFTRFATDKEPERWAPDEGLQLLPSLRDYVESAEYPFDWEHILAMAAPSAVLVVNSHADSKFSNPKSCQKAVTLAGRVYRLLGASGALDYYGHYDGHRITPETLEIADEWFERWL